MPIIGQSTNSQQIGVRFESVSGRNDGHRDMRQLKIVTAVENFGNSTFRCRRRTTARGWSLSLVPRPTGLLFTVLAAYVTTRMAGACRS
ncbi:hypothetical protein GWI33_006446 [Rhynchophorus ferrugineus]|uniref:Uncharacterized protein n=1 Tax=Rhynchophorus ferrugineus TaxID=354439 RepID=A0A834MDS2_RHYFE|nr:hypothetical protein GWI33_006446 [Rhynchophorus ferrugineus]